MWFFSIPLEGGRPTLARRTAGGDTVRVREVGLPVPLVPTGRPPPRETHLACAERASRRCLLIEQDEAGTLASWLDPPSSASLVDVDRMSSFALSPDGATLSAVSVLDGVRLFDARAGFAALPLPGAPARAQSLAFAPDGARLFVTSVDEDSHARLVSLDTTAGVLTRIFDEEVNWLQGVAVDRAGTHLAGGEMFMIADVYRVELPDR